jgi:hypothetical protein
MVGAAVAGDTEMIVQWMILFSAITAPPQASRPVYNCPEAVRATASAYRLSELPEEIRQDLMALTNDEITDEDVPLLATNAPTAAERNHATVRFAQALRFRDLWLIQFEGALFSGVPTIGYVIVEKGRFKLSPRYTFGGPACLDQGRPGRCREFRTATYPNGRQPTPGAP